VSSSPLADLAPAALWRAFADLCAIPHPSRHETAIIAFLRDRAATRGLPAEIDAKGNLIVRKPATPGKETRPGVILQAHVDMVPQANAGTLHDFAIDPIRPRVENGWVVATGTTLGADNGIGAAAMLALIEDKAVAHGPLEFLFTVEEEIGLNGARAVAPGALKGSILLNLDSEDDGRITIGCAGGRDVTATLPLPRAAVPAGSLGLRVAARGLKGGHSGLDIHKGHGNAIRILARALRAAVAAAPSLRLASISGGTARNAIPREAEALIVLSPGEEAAARAAIAAATAEMAAELAFADPGLSIAVEAAKAPADGFADATPLLRALSACADGIARLSDTPARRARNLQQHRRHRPRGVRRARRLHGAQQRRYRPRRPGGADRRPLRPGGRGNPPRRALPRLEAGPEGAHPRPLSDLYRQRTGTAPAVDSVHAGLECAILGATYPNWEMVSIGPNIRNPHSPDERVEVASVGNFWTLLTAALEAV
jgi:dipeptidase D